MNWTTQDLQGRPGIRRVNGESAVQPPKRKKMRNEETIVDGFKFPSKLEANFYKKLKLELKAGEVFWFTRQVPFWLEGNVKYVLDFLICERASLVGLAPFIRFVDTTGKLTRTKINKLKGMRDRYGILVEIIGKDGSKRTIDDIGGNRYAQRNLETRI